MLSLALRGLNGARSLWHDMSWAFACALCLFCTACLVLGVGGGGIAAPSGFIRDSDPVRVRRCLVQMPF